MLPLRCNKRPAKLHLEPRARVFPARAFELDVRAMQSLRCLTLRLRAALRSQAHSLTPLHLSELVGTWSGYLDWILFVPTGVYSSLLWAL